MKTFRDSMRFMIKVTALVLVLAVGYVQKNQSNSPAKKGAVDLIMNDLYNQSDQDIHNNNHENLNV